MKAELLAPAGSYESLIAAVNAGADAVYLGGPRFGARAYANNLDQQMLLDAIDYCHLHGSRLYLTVNTLLKEQELEQELFAYLKPLYEHGLDAVIIQDLGVLSFIKEQFSGLDIHASTQMTVTGSKGCWFLQEQGASRVVLARELSLREIKEISADTTIEIEAFVHGALCYCYSGQCLFSSLLGGRSGNRGRCAQPCRLPYRLEDEKSQCRQAYLLSPKDICTLELLPEIIEAGVYSLKIEGRMKRPEYTAGCVRIYRKYLDRYLTKGREGYLVSDQDKKELMDLYNRGGFSTGYYQCQNGKAMMSMDRPNHSGTSAVKIESVKKGRALVRALEELYQNDALDVSASLDSKHKELILPENVKKGSRFTIDISGNSHLHPGQVLQRIRCEKLLSEINKNYIERIKKEKINGKLVLSKGQPAILSITMKNIQLEIRGEIPTDAKKQPLTVQTVKQQLEKTGNTPFVFEHLEIMLEENSFLPLQRLNELRRQGLEMLKQHILAPSRRQMPDSLKRCASLEAPSQQYSSHEASLQQCSAPEIPVQCSSPEAPSQKCASPELSAKQYPNPEIAGKYCDPAESGAGYVLRVSLERPDAFNSLVSMEGIKGIYLDSVFFDTAITKQTVTTYVAACHLYNKECYYIMPWIMRSSAQKEYQQPAVLEALKCFDGILVKNMESFMLLRQYYPSARIFLDHNLYTYNKRSRRFWENMGVKMDTAPYELNIKELGQRGAWGSELIIYGRQPMMVSAQCLKKNTGVCSPGGRILSLKDRKGKRLPVRCNCQLCYNVIYNATPLILLDMTREIKCIDPASLRLVFTVETATEIIDITKRYVAGFLYGDKVEIDDLEFTRGRFKRGIE